MRTFPLAPRARRSLVRRCLAVAAIAGLMFVSVQPSAEAHDSKTWVVHPGESIQAAVDKAKSGDTIKILAGTYTEAVCVDHKGLKVRGAGPDATIIAVPDPLPDTECWDPGAPEGQPIENVSALKFLYPDSPVVVTDLQTTGHPESGIVAWGADGFVVKHTKGVGHKIYGILATAGSKNILIADNVEEGVVRDGRSGTAGISVGDSADSNALILGNKSSNENLGIFVREASGGIVADNLVTGNCAGVLVFDDANTEKPTVTGTIEGGHWDVVGNKSKANNRLCIAGRSGDLKVSGVGIAVVNADHVWVHRNNVVDNVPAVPAAELNFPAAGVDVLRVPSPTGGPDPGPADKVRVSHNRFSGNAPLDILLYNPEAPDDAVVFKDNDCSASNPPEICSPS